MPIRRPWILPLLCICGPLAAGELAAPTVAKFIHVILKGTGTKSVACADKAIAGELANLGVTVEGDSKIAWADTDKEVAALAKQGKLVVCGTRSLLGSGAGLAVVAEGGRPVIYLDHKAVAASGVTLPDTIVKLSKVAP